MLKKMILFIKQLGRLFIPIKELMKREKENISTLRVMKIDPGKDVGTLKEVAHIRAERATAYRCFLENFENLLPETLQITKKVTPGPQRLGTRYIAIPNFLTKPAVYAEITTMKDGQELVYEYLEGSPFAGSNSIVFKDNGLGSDIEAALQYQLKGVETWIGWFLFGGKRFHKRLILEGIKNLKVLLEEKNEDT